MRTALLGMLMVCTLGISGCGGGATPAAGEPKGQASAAPSSVGPEKDSHYSSVADLKTAAVQAGYQCASWVQDNVVDLAAESGHCSDDDVFSTFATQADLQSQLETSKGMDEMLKEAGVATDPTLVGPNWMIHGPGADGLADELGGTVYTPE